MHAPQTPAPNHFSTLDDETPEKIAMKSSKQAMLSGIKKIAKCMNISKK